MASTRKPKPTVAEDSSGVRTRILLAAFASLHESGLQNFTQTSVAERAGVRQSHLTYYFPTRQDLLEAVTAAFVERLTDSVVGTMDDSVGIEAMLAQLTSAITKPDHMRMFLAVTVEADGDPALRKTLVRATRRIESAIAERLGGAQATERARALLAAMWGLGLYQFLVRSSMKGGTAQSYLEMIGVAAQDGDA